MKRIMIVNWRWKQFQDNKSLKIEEVNDERVLFISRFKNNDLDIKEFNDFIKKQKNSYSPEYLFVLTHYHHSYNKEINIDRDYIDNLTDRNTTMKVINFSYEDTISRYIYGENGMIDTSHEDYSNQLKSKNYENVWEYFWNKIEFYNNKKQLIYLWLPLAIDIQGLSEMKDGSSEYYNDIKKELFDVDNNKGTPYYESLRNFTNTDEIPRWGEIESELKDGFNEFKPSNLISVIKDKKFSDFINDQEKYLLKEKDGEPNPSFLPNWLGIVINILDNKIKQSNQ